MPSRRREYTFRAQGDAPVDSIAQSLATHVRRPVVSHYATSSESHVPAYHRRALAGTNRTLQTGQDSIRFVSDKPADSRTWLYRDTASIGKPDAVRDRVTTN